VLLGDDSNNVIYRLTEGEVPPTLTPQKLATEILAPEMPATIQVGSQAFVDGGMIPVEYTAYGDGRSPPLGWSGLPRGTQSVVLMMEDAQATSPLPFVHWLAIMPPWLRQLPEDMPRFSIAPNVPRTQQGSNSRSETGYFGPRPPAGDPPHAYRFQVFALDVPLWLPTGFNRHTLIKAMQGHVLARGELTGTFQK
jgi:Raf kinase inhibitor-like YbhB/YbcL family protein